ncbi:MAG: O-antigen ligase family protein [Candidatus Nitronauta litoralis]|uniref:O-antigen ligase family protein n=1 Tax=Candidatus Nitronauta litoralis TaxID=2705533 RepID=A0A7T0FZ26_9BACT|nr:MAG: O-antigen ligase family protein [Candidatus Nitronauta litoralis]
MVPNKKSEIAPDQKAFPEILDRMQWGCLILFSVGCFVSISLAQISALAGFLTWLMQLRITRFWERIQIPVLLPIALFAGASICSTIFSVDWQVSIKTLKKLFEILIFFWAINALRTIGSAPSFINRLFFFNNTKENPLSSNGENLVRLFTLWGVLAALYSFYEASLHGIQLPHRVVGTFDNPISWGVILMMLSLLAFANLIYSSRKSRVLSGLLFSILVSCLIITLAREAWLGFTISISGMLFFRKPLLAVIAPLTFILILVLLPHSIQERLLAMTDFSQQTLKLRIQMWQGGWEIFKDYPVIGCGYNCSSFVANDYRGYEKFLQTWAGGFHNNFVQIAVELGSVGLLTWISIWVVFFWLSILRLQALNEDHPDRWLIHGSIWAIAAFLIACIFESHFYDTEVAMILFMIMALPFSITSDSKGVDEKNTLGYLL